ncbi:hypothetical protein D9756_007936 [Leucocoprinus leucothites]|uniref:Uncharacterized protein n=1 Tax=Leucocoprinus leucothites TaxID=201217 RepID=A0A8H5D4G9_9AGAR|nr:hypothetical protein D9756_007936 [Leucoagaricus leucothites]
MFTYDIVILFDVLVLLSILLVAFALLPAVSSRYVSRSVGWYSLMTGWLVFSLSYGLIVGYQGERRPPLSLCTFQTLLIYAVPQLVATSLLCYYIETAPVLSHNFRAANRQATVSKSNKNFSSRLSEVSWSSLELMQLLKLAVAPWVVFFFNIVTVSILIFPGNRLHLVERAPNNFYCHLSNPIPATITSATVIVTQGSRKVHMMIRSFDDTSIINCGESVLHRVKDLDVLPVPNLDWRLNSNKTLCIISGSRILGGQSY